MNKKIIGSLAIFFIISIFVLSLSVANSANNANNKMIVQTQNQTDTVKKMAASDTYDYPNNFVRTDGNIPSADFNVSTYREINALDNYPLLVGGMAHGSTNINILKQLGIGNFVWVGKQGYGMGNTPWDTNNWWKQDVDAITANGMYFMLSSHRGLGEVEKGGGYDMGGDTELFTPADKETQDYIKNIGGKYFIGWHAEELDADMLQTNIQPAFSDRNPELYNYETTGQARVNYENELIRLQKQAHNNGGMFISNQCVTSHLNAFRAGNDIVIAELLEHLTNTELQLSYLRGGAQQFGGSWGIWVSPWYDGVPTADKGLWPAKFAQPGLGHKPSSFRKTIYESYVSGARIITAQETEPLFARSGNSYKDVLWGTELKNFWNYAKNHQEVMTPIVPAAMMIDRDNGWQPGNLFGNWAPRDTVWGKLMPTDGDSMLSQFINAFLPGYKRTAESVASRKDLYPGYFAATPVGPFDMVASDISPERLRKYPVVSLMGDIKFNAKILNTLKEYVNGGGTLLINSSQLKSNNKFMDDPDFFGYQLRAFSENWLLSSRVNNTGLITLNTDIPYMNKTSYSGLYSAAVNGVLKGGEVVAVDANKMPVVVRNSYGSGKVYLTLTNNMMDSSASPKPLEFYNDLLRALVLGSNCNIKVMPSAEGGTKDFSWHASYQGSDSIVVVITNNGASNGYVDINYTGDSTSAAVDVGMNDLTETATSTGKVFKVKVAADDVTVLRIMLY